MIERQLTTMGQSTRIVIGENALASLGSYLSRSQSLIVVEPGLVARMTELCPDLDYITVSGGESCKSLFQVENLYATLLERGVDRSTTLVGVGGGALLDLVGFVAATYLRGLPCALIPSTLLAQVDASLGGKNGVNFGRYKNIIGTIRQPDLVLCDLGFLTTLPDDEFRSGLAEVIKYGAIADRAFVDFLFAHRNEIRSRDSRALAHVVDRSLAIKQHIVEKDPQEKGLRRILNFGHTVGHALEHVSAIKHGFAISIGMAVAAHLSVTQEILSPEAAQELQQLLHDFGLPTSFQLNIAEIVPAIARDKKREGDYIHSVLLASLGSAVVEKLPLKAWEIALRSFQEQRRS